MLVHRNSRIQTYNESGVANGFLVPIFNIHDKVIKPEQYPQQVYPTLIAPWHIKGPHLHLKRWGLFTCIRGHIKIVVRTGTAYEEYLSGENHAFATVQVPAGIPAALQNITGAEAYVLNMPSPAWKSDDQDEYPVSFGDYVFAWPERASNKVDS
jgi:dTDP-4-dehydrorhamnose 3,5-epimerase-like enzyme